MRNIKAFSLLEIIIVSIILGVLAAMSFPSFQGFINSGRANDAQNNLLSIYVAQRNVQASGLPGFCVNNPCVATGVGDCTNTTGLNTCLGLSIIENNITYSCTNPTGFTCVATVAGGFTMTLTNVAPRLTGALNSGGRNPICAGTCPN